MSSTLCPPCTKPSTLNADRKVQNRGNARARVFKVRLICPAVVTKTRGAEAISAAASSACAALRRAAACGILPHAHAKRKRKHSNHHWPPIVAMHSTALPALPLPRLRMPASSARTASASFGACYAWPAAERARKVERAGWRSVGGRAPGARRPELSPGWVRPSTDGRKGPAGRRGGRFARAQTAASARRLRGSRAPGCNAPWSASSPTCRASASAAGRRLPRNTP